MKDILLMFGSFFIGVGSRNNKTKTVFLCLDQEKNFICGFRINGHAAPVFKVKLGAELITQLRKLLDIASEYEEVEKVR